MLDKKGFDLWADGYDKSVNLSEENNTYPFAGYREVLNIIYNAVHEKKQARVLDIGFGTGVLTKRLYDDGYEIYGIDFSDKMIEIAKEKMPGAVLCQHDFTEGLPKAFAGISFDYIISTYAIHHLDDEQKEKFLHGLQACLNPGGLILLGDVAFDTRKELEACRADSGDAWDEDEIYLVFEELARRFPTLRFEKVSYCSGVMIL